MNLKGFDSWTTPGIRAQLLDINTLELVQDFIVESDENSIHILNAVSPENIHEQKNKNFNHHYSIGFTYTFWIQTIHKQNYCI